jgi:hypothetical protein
VRTCPDVGANVQDVGANVQDVGANVQDVGANVPGRRCKTELWCSRGRAVQKVLLPVTFCTAGALLHPRCVLHPR